MKQGIADSQTGRLTRMVTSEGWRTTQVQQLDGTWWNIRVERVGRGGV